MKKLILLLVILFVCVPVFGLDAEINLYQENYYAGNTLQVEVMFNNTIERFNPTNIKLNCNNQFKTISPSVLNLKENRYFFYFNLDESLEEGNCTLFLENIIYPEKGILNVANFNKSFYLGLSNVSLSVYPAGIGVFDIYDQNLFYIQLINSGQSSLDLEINSDVEFIEISKEEISLLPGESTTFNLYISPLLIDDSDFQKISISFFENNFIIPIWLFPDEEVVVNSSNYNESGLSDEPLIDFLMDVSNISLIINTSQDISGYVQIINNGVNLEEVSFSLSGNLSEIINLGSDKISGFSYQEIYKQYLYINQRKNAKEGIYSGDLIVNYNSLDEKFPILVQVSNNNKIIDTNETDLKNNTQTKNDKKEGISIWIYVISFFIIGMIFIYILYKKRTKNLSKRNFPVR